MSTNTSVSLMGGISALPRRSGDLVFHDNWEKRIFAIAIALHERDLFSWKEFQSELIKEIKATGESAANPMPDRPGYYEHWLSALETLLSKKKILLDDLLKDSTL